MPACTVQRNETERRSEHQDRRACLEAKRRQQQKPGDKAAGDRAGRVRKIEHAGAPANGALSALNDRIRERKTEPHEECRQRHLQ